MTCTKCAMWSGALTWRNYNLLARPVIGRNSRSTPVCSMLKVHHGSEERVPLQTEHTVCKPYCEQDCDSIL